MALLKEKIIFQQHLTVVFAGDSQVWGQGAAGWRKAMPDFKAGELRRLPDTVPSFVAMFKRYLGETRGDERESIVINSGVGSTPVYKYYECYWSKMVIAHKPDIVIIMSAINDWIHGDASGLDNYRRMLAKMTEELFSAGSEVVMVTESPILGAQYNGYHYYDDYIDAFRKAALANPRILLADANRRMKVFLADGDFEHNSRILFEDKWHVSQVGHFIYLKAITDAIGI